MGTTKLQHRIDKQKGWRYNPLRTNRIYSLTHTKGTMLLVQVGLLFVSLNGDLTADRKNAAPMNLPDAEFAASFHEGAVLTAA